MTKHDIDGNYEDAYRKNYWSSCYDLDHVVADQDQDHHHDCHVDQLSSWMQLLQIEILSVQLVVEAYVMILYTV